MNARKALPVGTDFSVRTSSSPSSLSLHRLPLHYLKPRSRHTTFLGLHNQEHDNIHHFNAQWEGVPQAILIVSPGFCPFRCQVSSPLVPCRSIERPLVYPFAKDPQSLDHGLSCLSRNLGHGLSFSFSRRMQSLAWPEFWSPQPSWSTDRPTEAQTLQTTKKK